MERIVSALILLGVMVAVVFGYLRRHDSWLDPETGYGYYLGIIGGSMMLLLLAYPLRKRALTKSRAMGSVGFWFRFHMLLGLIGPLAILYHSRFSWGALNSAVALGSMIVVATSGLVGRFLYGHVHRGYSGRKLELRSLKEDMDNLLNLLEANGFSHEQVLERLLPFEERAVAAGGAFWTSARSVVTLGLQTRITLRFTLSSFFVAVRRAAEFAFYDRLLRLWQLLHMPLFVLLFGATILHIVAVHMY
jgi:hypothetical protein